MEAENSGRLEGRAIAESAERVVADMGFVNSRGHVNPHPDVKRHIRYHDPQRVRLLYDEIDRLRQEAATERESREIHAVALDNCQRKYTALGGKW